VRRRTFFLEGFCFADGNFLRGTSAGFRSREMVVVRFFQRLELTRYSTKRDIDEKPSLVVPNFIKLNLSDSLKKINKHSGLSPFDYRQTLLSGNLGSVNWGNKKIYQFSPRVVIVYGAFDIKSSNEITNLFW